MLEIDSEDIKQCIVEQLLKIAPDVTVYKEAKSKLQYPHFFIYQVDVIDEEERKNVHFITYSIDVRYRVVDDPSTDLKLQQNLDSMTLTLLSKFNIINFEDSKVRCLDKNCEKVDGVLHFFFNIKVMVKDISEEEKPKLDKLDLEVIINGM